MGRGIFLATGGVMGRGILLGGGDGDGDGGRWREAPALGAGGLRMPLEAEGRGGGENDRDLERRLVFGEHTEQESSEQLLKLLAEADLLPHLPPLLGDGGVLGLPPPPLYPAGGDSALLEGGDRARAGGLRGLRAPLGAGGERRRGERPRARRGGGEPRRSVKERERERREEGGEEEPSM